MAGGGSRERLRWGTTPGGNEAGETRFRQRVAAAALALGRVERLGLWLGASLEREIDAGIGFLWLPVGFALGVLLYFAAPSEPFGPALFALSLGAWGISWRARHARAGLLYTALGVAMIASGMAAMKLRTDRLATPMIERQVTGTLSGWVEHRDARRGGYRLTVRVAAFEGRRSVTMPERVTVTVRGRAAPMVGDGISALVQLRPPSGPALPGSYDFGRNAFFEGIGATGFAYGAPKRAEIGPAPFAIRLMRPLEDLREAIRAEILDTLQGDTARIATALIIGDAGGISEAAEDDLRQSGLAHILSVSGLHMVLVAGAVFWSVRALLAFVPGLALRRPIKKWAALAALAVTGFYLLISGLDVAAQRSFIMTAVAFLAILLDRRAISMRNVAIAALIVLAIAPESILSASFQMSFAATMALVAGFEALAAARSKRVLPRPEMSTIGRGFRWAIVLVGGLALTSLLGGLGSTPFALYHFQRMAPLSIVANVLAMPLTDFLVMPMALISVIVMPFGFAAPLLQLMGVGIDGMLGVARLVSEWSAGSGGAAMPSAVALMIFVAGFLWLSLMRQRWRLVGLAPMLVGGALALTPERPEVLVAADGRMVGLRDEEGRYRLVARKVDDFIADIWLRSDGDPRDPKAPTLMQGTTCDGLGCVGRLADGRILALTLDRAAFEEDCRRAQLLVTPLVAPAACYQRIVVIDRPMLERTGSLALLARQVAAAPDAAREADAAAVTGAFDTPADGPPIDITDLAVNDRTPLDEDRGDDATRYEALETPLLARRTPNDEDLPPVMQLNQEAQHQDDPETTRPAMQAAERDFIGRTAYPATRRPWMPPVPQRPEAVSSGG
ncbi:ComEC/Rec2 family competence protein [Kaistia dalseonensis]|uniref:Competence protein ComEC n=1 Tax=Kaistia dalseonensis TaxID=410840 RepID=A0ABU0H2Y3_9HYPH|nr:ComEC/Rec2 family competence protein [Kaistia dalseonensis]MCX5493842.1 ComEC/Rec2 family competence protein [Kaistia dalseonensis]MDQ0436407.1 competence protein ComEC [Kaistia dalseonensis]